MLYILDAAVPNDWAEALAQLPASVPVTLIFNKIDLTGEEASIDESIKPATGLLERQNRLRGCAAA